MRSKLRFLTLVSGIGAVLVWAAAALLLTTSTPVTSPVPTAMALPSAQDNTDIESVADRSVASSVGSVQSDFMRDSTSQTVAGQVVIRFASNATHEQRAVYLASIGGTVSSTIDALDTVIMALPKNTTIPPSDIVAASEPDYYVRALYSVPTSDTYYTDQWALTAIGAPGVWSSAANAPKLTVAVIDSGVFAGHSDLSGRVLSGWDFVQDDALPQDEFGHGTAISGILAANIDNGIGIAGVAPNVEILPLRVLNGQGIGTYSDVAAAIVYATDNDARIINLSLGGANPSSLLEGAVTYATSRGVMVVAAAGNSGVEGALYPAAYPAVIAVGAVDSTLERSSFSNYGPQIDVYAPGRDILATGKDGGYVRVSGTSFAAPHVVGVAALELARGRSLSLNSGIVTILPLDTDNSQGQVTALATFSVDTAIDDVDAIPGNGVCATSGGDCSLRAAIMEANALSGTDTIDLPAATYTLAIAGTGEDSALTGDLDIFSPITINGAGSATTIIDGASVDRIFDIMGGVTVNISGVTIQNGAETNGGGVFNSGATLNLMDVILSNNTALGSAGALYNSSGNVTITSSIVLDNTAQWGAGIFNDLGGDVQIADSVFDNNDASSNGGGLFNSGLSTVTITTSTFTNHDAIGWGGAIYNDNAGPIDIFQSTISNNQAVYGGGLANIFSGIVNVTNTTISGNTASRGGGIFNDLGADVTAKNSTLFSNAATEAGNRGGGFYNNDTGSTISLFNAIVADSTGTDCAVGGLASYLGSSNLSDESSGCQGVALFSSSINLDVLADNGGLTLTHMPQLGSSAIDAGDATICNSPEVNGLDQRGIARTIGMGCDIGAVEAPSLCDSVTEIPQSECEALEALYNSTNGASWLIATDWFMTTTPCSWYGITCDAGHVSGLNLSANQLDGSLPSELDNLDSLQTLVLRDNQLTGGLPAELGSMDSLLWLDLTNNDLSGGIPVGLGNAPSLIVLILADNPTLAGTIPASIGNISTLVILSLYNTGLTGEIPPELGQLTNLQELHLSGNQLTGNIPPQLSTMSSLEVLGLSDNQLTGSIPTTFGSLSNLEFLVLYNNRLSGAIPAELGNLTNLETLLLNNNAFVGEIPASITALTALGTVDNLPTDPWPLIDDEVDLAYNALYASPAVTTFLSGIDPDWADTQTVAPENLSVVGWNGTGFDLSWTPITYTGDGGFYEVLYSTTPGGPYSQSVRSTDKTSSGVSTLDLTFNTDYYFVIRTVTPAHGEQQNDVTSELSDEISARTPYSPFCAGVSEIPQDECGALEVFYNSTGGAAWTNNMGWLTDPTPCSDVTWFGVTCNGTGNITRIGLENNQLSGTLPSQLSDLTSLQVLSLSNNQLTGSIPVEIGNITALQQLDLANNQLTGPIPTSIGSLPNLESIALHHNQLTGSIPSTIGNLTNLVWLSLEHNQLSGSIPAEMGDLTNLQHLFLNDNQLNGSIPPSLGNLDNLFNCYLHSNQLTGAIPVELGNMDSLGFLMLFDNQLNGPIPAELGNITTLLNLFLDRNQLSGSIPPELGNLSNLVWLGLSENQLTGSIPPELGDITSLAGLQLNDNQLSGNLPPELGDLTGLESLFLQNNAFSGEVPAEIANLTTLGTANNFPIPPYWLNDDEVNFGFNTLYVTDPVVMNFLLSKDPDWVYTQTIAPKQLTVSGTTIDSITLSWSPILYTGDGGYYEVEIATNIAGPFTLHGTTPDKSASGYAATGLDDDTTYYFRVRTFTPAHGDQQNDLYSEYTDIIAATPLAPPSPPINLTGGPATMNTMPLAWEDTADDETHYSVERSSNGVDGWTPIALLPADTEMYTDTGLACNTTYHYRVRAYRAGDGKYSLYSNTAFATTLTCPPPEPQTAGLYKDGLWIFRDTNSTGQPDVSFRFGPQQAGWTPLVGDWDGDGVDGIGVYKDGMWILRNSASSGLRDMAFAFNPLGTGAVPVVGDWNSDGIDTIGVFKNGLWALKNSNSAGSHDMAFTFNPGTGWMPVTGDWNGDNFDTVGFYKDGRWLLTNTLQSSPVTFNFKFGPATTGWMPVTGDWDATNGDSIGLYKDGVWRLRNTNDAGGPDNGFTFITGAVGWKPVAGYRGGVSGLMALGLSDEVVDSVLPTLSTPTPEATETAAPEVSATVTLDTTTETPIESPTATETPLAPTDTPTEITPTATESHPPPTETQSAPSEIPETTESP